MKGFPSILLGAFLGAMCLTNILWIHWNTAPPRMFDDAEYLSESIDLYHLLKAGEIGTFLEECTTASRQAHPPMMKLLPVPAFFVLGPGVQAGLWAYTLLIPVFGVYLFLLARSLLGREDSALLAVMIACLFPLTYGLWRNVMAEFGTAVATVGALYHLRASSGYRARSHLFVLGLFLGWGLLWKISFPLFVVGPLLYVAIQRLRTLQPGEAKDLARSVMVVLAVAAIVAGPIYLRNFHVLWTKFQSSAGDTPYNQLWGLGPAFSLHTVARYWLLLVNLGVSSYFAFLLLILVLLHLAVLRRRIPGAGFLAAWLLPPFVVLSFTIYKEPRFLLPALPVFAIVGAALLGGALASASRPVRLAVCTLALAFPLYQYGAYSFDSRFLPRPDIRFGPFIVSIANLQRASLEWMPSYAFPATPTRWPTAETVAVLTKLSGGRAASIGFSGGHPLVNATVLGYESRVSGFPLRFQEGVSGAEFLVMLTSPSGLYGPMDARNQFLQKVLDDRRLPFAEIARVPLKDPGEVLIYTRMAGPGGAVRPWRSLPEEFEACGASFYDGAKETFLHQEHPVSVFVPRAGTIMVFPYVYVPDSGATLHLSFGLDDRAASRACNHTVGVGVTQNPGQIDVVFERTIDPAKGPRWFDENVALKPVGDGIITLALAVESNPETDGRCDPIGWAAIELSYAGH